MSYKKGEETSSSYNRPSDMVAYVTVSSSSEGRSSSDTGDCDMGETASVDALARLMGLEYRPESLEARSRVLTGCWGWEWFNVSMEQAKSRKTNENRLNDAFFVDDTTRNNWLGFVC